MNAVGYCRPVAAIRLERQSTRFGEGIFRGLASGSEFRLDLNTANINFSQGDSNIFAAQSLLIDR
jgi:hypothetical protein